MSKNTNLSFLTDYITADITNGRIGIFTASPTVAFDVTGAGKFSGVLTLGSTISNGTYAYTLPSATGTLALTSALSGTTNYIAKFTSATAIGDSLIFDNGTNLGIGTTTLSASTNYRALNINGTTGSEIYLKGSNVDYGYIYANSSAVVLATQTAIPLNLQTNAVTRLSISSTGAATFSSGQTGGYVTSSSGFVNETKTITTNATSYYLIKSTGTSNGSSTTTFDITGMSTTNGTYADIYAIAQKDSTASAINTNVQVNINGQTMNLPTLQANGTGANTVRCTFRVCRMESTWVIIGLPNTTYF